MSIYSPCVEADGQIKWKATDDATKRSLCVDNTGKIRLKCESGYGDPFINANGQVQYKGCNGVICTNMPANWWLHYLTCRVETSQYTFYGTKTSKTETVWKSPFNGYDMSFCPGYTWDEWINVSCICTKVNDVDTITIGFSVDSPHNQFAYSYAWVEDCCQSNGINGDIWKMFNKYWSVAIGISFGGESKVTTINYTAASQSFAIVPYYGNTKIGTIQKLHYLTRCPTTEHCDGQPYHICNGSSDYEDFDIATATLTLSNYVP